MPKRITSTDEDIRASLERFGGIVGIAGRHLGMSPRTLNRRLAADPNLKTTLYHVHEGITDIALGVMIQRVHAGDPKACFWWLDRFGAERGYGRRRASCDLVDPAETARLLLEFAKFCPELREDVRELAGSPSL